MAFVLSTGVVKDIVENETVLYKESGDLFVLNETASLIVSSILQSGSLSFAVESIVREYDIDQETVWHDGRKCLEEMLSLGLISDDAE